MKPVKYPSRSGIVLALLAGLTLAACNCAHAEAAGTPPPAALPDGVAAALVTAVLGGIGTLIYFFIRKHFENQSVWLAILAETKRLYHVIGRHYEWRQRVAGTGTGDPAKQAEAEPLIAFSFPVYQAQIKKIGILPHDKVGDVVTFYGWVDYINNFQGTRKKYIAMSRRQEFDHIYNAMLKKFLTETAVNFSQGYTPGKPDQVPGA